MCPLLHDFSSFKHINDVGFFDCRKAVTNGDDSFSLVGEQAFKDARLSQGINSTGRFVQDDDWTIAVKITS